MVDSEFELEHALDLYDAASLSLLQLLITQPATPGWGVASTLGMAASVTKARERIHLLRQYLREQRAQELKSAVAADHLHTNRRAAGRHHHGDTVASIGEGR